MKRILFALLLLPQLAYSQYRADCFRLDLSDNASHIRIGNTFDRDTTLSISERRTISGLSISGTAVLNNDNDSYIRVTLVDNYNYEFLVYEIYPTLSDDLTTKFSNIALETILLDDITPQCLKISMLNASLELDTISFLNASANNRQNSNNPVAIQKAQTQYIVDKLNTNLKRRNMTWRAGITAMSNWTYSEKKNLYGGTVPVFYGLEYYVDGIFVIPGDFLNSLPRSVSSDPYVSEWDWRNRHGKNWMTNVKKQGDSCGSCWAHAAVGMVEAYINLYYNRILNYDLSEQEIISCTGTGCSYGYVSSALYYIKNSGVVNETCFGYSGTFENCSLKCPNPDEHVYIQNYQNFLANDGEELIKQQLFKNPLTAILSRWRHSMIIAGYKKIEEGDLIFLGNEPYKDSVIINSQYHQNLIGKTAWLFKDSHGISCGNNGYYYVVVDVGRMRDIYTATGKITCLDYNDSHIVCTDADGDGYYFWGVGPKPANCPSGVHDTPDGDDSNSQLGPMNQFGYLTDLSNLSSQTVISGNTTYSATMPMSNNTVVIADATLTITGTVTIANGVKLTVHYNGKLIIDGGTLQNADLLLNSGCQVILKNGGKIIMRSGKNFDAPLGAIVNIEYGEIN